MIIHRPRALAVLMRPALKMGLAFAIVVTFGTNLITAEEASATPSPSAAGNTDTPGHPMVFAE
jgi:hypothetical protein